MARFALLSCRNGTARPGPCGYGSVGPFTSH